MEYTYFYDNIIIFIDSTNLKQEVMGKTGSITKALTGISYLRMTGIECDLRTKIDFMDPMPRKSSWKNQADFRIPRLT